MSHFDCVPRGKPATMLTPRQYEIIGLIAEGLTNGEIAQRLGLSRAVVNVEILEVMSTLDVPNRVRLAVWFVRHPT